VELKRKSLQTATRKQEKVLGIQISQMKTDSRMMNEGKKESAFLRSAFLIVLICENLRNLWMKLKKT